jgi:predicted lipid carrier protein YhbT
VRREHAKGDVAVRAPASDLLLFLWGRIPPDRLEVMGDTALLPRWFELVPMS